MRITAVEIKLLEYELDEPFYPTWLPGYPQTFNRLTCMSPASSSARSVWIFSNPMLPYPA